MEKRGVRDMYKKYKKDTDTKLTGTEYVKIVGEFSKFIVQKLMDKHEVLLPCRLGSISVMGKEQNLRIVDGKVKGLAPDWVKTKKLWDSNPKAKEEKKLVYHTNSETDGVIFRYQWFKKKALVVNKYYYSLRMSRFNKRLLHSLIKNGEQFRNT